MRDQQNQRLLAAEETVPGSVNGPGQMSDQSQRTFRAVALQRAASPEQLDHLVRITRPLDWIIVFVIWHCPHRRADMGHRRARPDPRRR